MNEENKIYFDRNMNVFLENKSTYKGEMFDDKTHCIVDVVDIFSVTHKTYHLVIQSDECFCVLDLSHKHEISRDVAIELSNVKWFALEVDNSSTASKVLASLGPCSTVWRKTTGVENKQGLCLC